jgi:hypothetical protein
MIVSSFLGVLCRLKLSSEDFSEDRIAEFKSGECGGFAYIGKGRKRDQKSDININGSATSYMDTFKNALEFLCKKLKISINNEIWEKYGPYSYQFNLNKVDIEETWERISEEIKVNVHTVKQAIAPVKDLYIILDHTRSVFMIIYDGLLPSNIGSGANVRNMLGRVFDLLSKNKWFEKLYIQGIFDLMHHHAKDLEGIYGEFNINGDIKEIIDFEYQIWTDSKQKELLEGQIKNGGDKLTLDDWILGLCSGVKNGGYYLQNGSYFDPDINLSGELGLSLGRPSWSVPHSSVKEENNKKAPILFKNDFDKLPILKEIQIIKKKHPTISPMEIVEVLMTGLTKYK